MATQAELQWINANSDLATQTFGSTNPADGLVTQFVSDWYKNNGNPTPDAIDGAILNPLSNPVATNLPQYQIPTVPNSNGGFIAPEAAEPGTVDMSGGNIPGNQPVASSVPITTQPTNSNVGLSSIVPNSGTTIPPAGTANAAAVQSGLGDNYRQDQTGAQTGAYVSTGQTQGTQNQTTGGTSQSDQISNAVQTNTGTTNQNQTTGGTTAGTTNINEQTTGTTNNQQTGTTSTTVDDTLGFGALLKDAATGANASDAARTAFLTDVMNTGGTQFGSQVDQAIRNSQTGSRMTGAGESSKDRQAAYAAAQIGRNNMGERLGAAQQLTGPTGLTTLSNAANPFLGSTNTVNLNNKGTTTANTTGTNTTSGTTSGFSNLIGENAGTSTTAGNTSNSGSQTGFANLINTANEINSGVTNASSSQKGAGLAPQGQPASGGGCVMCTAGLALGLPKSNMLRVLRWVIKFKLDRKEWSRAARGYFSLFTPIAAWFLSKPALARVLFPLARATVYEELRISGRGLPFKVWASFVHWTVHCLCVAVSYLPIDGRVKDERILSVARKHKILYEVLN